jgi:hypothetical protein
MKTGKEHFFFEKKKQKTFNNYGQHPRRLVKRAL